MKNGNEILILILFAGWGMVAWYCLSVLYAKYRNLQGRLGLIEKVHKDEQHYQGLTRTIIEILTEKFAEVKQNIIFNPVNWKK